VVATIDPSNAAVTRRAVCPAPRGLAYDASLDAIHVACVDGSLVTLPAAGGAAARRVFLDGDLRDVVVQNGKLYVSRFRVAELLEVASDGTITQRISPPSTTSTSMPKPGEMGGPTTSTVTPGVAYRTVGLPGGGLAMLHQRASDAPLAIMPGGYSDFGGCGGVVDDTITMITPGTAPSVALPLATITVAVDLAVSADGSQLAVAAPSAQGPTVVVYLLAQLTQPGPLSCVLPGNSTFFTGGQSVAVAFDAQSRLVMQTRAPATLVVNGINIALSSASTVNAGLDVFYTATKGGIACASCHPEGGDDGRVWQFTGLGPRRTQNIRGGVLARAPFHWSGDIPTMDDLVNVVFVGRMAGLPLTAQQTVDLGQWMDAQPALAAPPARDPAATARGQATFADPNVGCTGCHSGPQLSNHQLVDVGTGGTFKVPSLVAVRYRAPYLHDGCAATLLDRFGRGHTAQLFGSAATPLDRFGPPCGGGDQHGHTSQLTAEQLSDLVAYLESL
jgi:mono/diheme cytochrome c family protein